MDFDESGGFDRPVTVDDRLGAGILGVEGLLIAAGTPRRVLPDRPPCTGMLVRIPDRFGAFAAVVNDGVAMPWCDGVDDLPFAEMVTVQWKWLARSPGAFTVRDPTMNDSPAASSSLRFAADSMPASAATTIGMWRSWRWANAVMIGTMVVSAVLPSKQPISNGNPGAVNQQSDHDLRLNPTLLGAADFAQVVFGFGLEIQGRHVIEQQT